MILGMYRSILRGPSRSSIRGLLCGSVIPGEGKRNGPRLGESFQTISSLEGAASFGCSRNTFTNSLGLQIVSALQLGNRNQASRLLSELDASNPSRDVVDILDYCARSPDPLFVLEAWSVLEGENVNLSRRCYMLIMQALCNGGYLEEALRLVKYLQENHRTNFILPLCNYILSSCTKREDAIHANQCLDMMDYHLSGKNEVTYMKLLELAVLEKNSSAVHEIWKDYIKYYNTNILSLSKLIWSFAKLRDLESAYKALQQMVTLVLNKDTSCHLTVEGKTHYAQLDIPIPSYGGVVDMGFHLHEYGHASPVSVDEGMTLNLDNARQSSLFSAESVGTTWVRMIEKNQKVSTMSAKRVLRWSFNDVLHACAQCRDAELAEQLIMEMRNLGIEPAPCTYDGLVRAVMWDRDIDDTIEALKAMQQRNLKPYDSTLSALSIGSSRALDLDSAEAFLNQITKTSALPYNEFLEACDTMDQLERAVKMFARMRQLNIKPNMRTYELLFALFGNVNAPYEKGNALSQADVRKRVKAIELDMLTSGLQHTQLSMKNLLNVLGTEGMVQELLQYLRFAEQHFSHYYNTLETDVYNIVLHSLVEANENHVAIQMFRNMKLCGILPDAATYNIMIDCCSYIKCFKSACALVSMMLRDGFSPQTLTYTALMKILLDRNEFDDALGLLDQTISEGGELDVLLFNTILRKAYYRGRIDVIELVVEKMCRLNIQPDPSTCSYVFNAYVEGEFENTALEALQVLSMRMISHDSNTLEDARNKYEDLIICEEPDKPEISMVKIFPHSENLAAALMNLRWCFIAGSSISWVPDENPWAKRLASSYNVQTTEAL